MSVPDQTTTGAPLDMRFCNRLAALNIELDISPTLPLILQEVSKSANLAYEALW